MVRYKAVPLSDGEQFKGRRIGFSFVISKVFSLLLFLKLSSFVLKAFLLVPLHVLVCSNPSTRLGASIDTFNHLICETATEHIKKR